MRAIAPAGAYTSRAPVVRELRTQDRHTGKRDEMATLGSSLSSLSTDDSHFPTGENPRTGELTGSSPSSLPTGCDPRTFPADEDDRTMHAAVCTYSRIKKTPLGPRKGMNVVVVKNDHPAVARHERPRRNEPRSTTAMVAKTGLRIDIKALTRGLTTHVTTEPNEQNVNPRSEKLSLSTSKCLVDAVPRTSTCSIVLRSTRNAKPSSTSTSLSYNHTVFDARPKRFLTLGTNSTASVVNDHNMLDTRPTACLNAGCTFCKFAPVRFAFRFLFCKQNTHP